MRCRINTWTVLKGDISFLFFHFHPVIWTANHVTGNYCLIITSPEVTASSSRHWKLLPHICRCNAKSTHCHEQLHLKMNLAVHYLFQCWSKYRNVAPVVHKMWFFIFLFTRTWQSPSLFSFVISYPVFMEVMRSAFIPVNSMKALRKWCDCKYLLFKYILFCPDVTDSDESSSLNCSLVSIMVDHRCYWLQVFFFPCWIVADLVGLLSLM